MDWVQHLVGDAVPAIVEGGGPVLRRQRHHHQVVASARHVQQDDHGADGRGLAHRRALQGAAEAGSEKEFATRLAQWRSLVYSSGETDSQSTKPPSDQAQ